MQASFHYLRDIRLSALSAEDMSSLLANAVTLQRASGLPQWGKLLLGKSLAVVSSQGNDEAAEFFELAASDLGARVSHISPSLAQLGDHSGFESTARILARLYHGIECQGFDAQWIHRLELALPIPVYDGLGRLDHPTATLSAQLEGPELPESKRRLVVQAVLVSTLGLGEV